MSRVLRHRKPSARDDGPAVVLVPSADAPLLETALARSFELVAGVGFLALGGTALAVVLIPSSASGRVGFAVVLIAIGLALVALALSLSRRSARAVSRPLALLDHALAAITAGDLSGRVILGGAAAEIQYVGTSVNTMVRELTRLRVVEIERSKDQQVRRELAEVVHASLDSERIVHRAVDVVGEALAVDRVHVRLIENGTDRLVAEWCHGPNIEPIMNVSGSGELAAVADLIGVTDDANAVVINDARNVSRFSAAQREAFESLSIRAVLKYPIEFGGRIAGALVVSEQSISRPWTDSEVTLMEGFAREIGRALDHALAFSLQEQMVERLGVLDRSKNEFLAEVSRELRGPLATVLGYIELLTDDDAEPVTVEQRRMLGVIDRSGERLLVLIANLMTMSRMEAGEFAPDLAPMHLDAVIRRVREAVDPGVAKGFLDFVVNVEPGIELVADERQIERALHNLVSNAVKFTPGGGRVEIIGRSDGTDVVIDVRDTGCGIPEDEQVDLFSRFFSTQGAKRRERLGSGLSLYIAKQIIDGHDGQLRVRSVPGGGSTFTMRIPLVPAPTSRAGDRSRAERGVGANAMFR